MSTLDAPPSTDRRSSFTQQDSDNNLSSAQSSSSSASTNTLDRITFGSPTEEWFFLLIKAIKVHPWEGLPHYALLGQTILYLIQCASLVYVPFIQWGLIPQQVIHYGIRNLSTFGLHHLPYEGLIACSVLFLVMTVVWMASMYGSKRFQEKQQIGKWMMLISQTLLIVLAMLSLPIQFTYSSFWSCNYTSAVSATSEFGTSSTIRYFLRSHPTQECWSGLNTGFAVVSLFGGLFHLVMVSVVFVVAIADPSPYLFPLKREDGWLQKILPKKAIMASVNPKINMLLWAILQIYVWFEQLVPSMEKYTFLYSSVYMLLTLLVIAVLIYKVPFYRRIENSIMIGFHVGALFASMVCLIASLVNVDFNEINGYVFLGCSLGAFILISMIGLVTCEISLRIYITRSLEQLSHNMTHSSTEIMEVMGQRKLTILLQTAIASRKMEKESIIFTECKKFLSLIRKQKIYASDSSLVRAISCLYVRTATKEQSTKLSHAISIIATQLKQKLNPIDRLSLLIQRGEKEFLKKQEEARLSGFRRNEQIDKTLSELFKKQQYIFLLQKSFWKHVLSNSDDSIEMIQHVNEELSICIKECSKSYETIYSQHSNSLSVLKSYARYSEKILFQNDLTEELIRQYTMIEEEEEAHRKKHISITKRSGTGNARHVDYQQEEFSSSFDDLDEAVNYSPEKNQTESYDFLINKQPNYNLLLILLFVIPCYVILGITGGLIGIVIQSKLLDDSSVGFHSNVYMYQEMCDVAKIPYYLLLDLRTLQELELKSLTNHTELLKSTYKDRFVQYSTSIKGMLGKYATSSDNLISSVVKAYQQEYHEIFIPILVDQHHVNSSIKNITLSEIYSMMALQIDNLALQDELRAEGNYPYLFFLENRDVIPLIISNFCTSIIENNRNNALIQMRDFLLGLSVAFCGFLIVSLFLFSFIIVKFREKKLLIDLFKKLPKEEVGQIYHNIKTEKKSAHASEKKKSLGWTKNPAISVPLLLFLSFIMGSVAFAAFIYDSTNNMTLQYNSMLKFRDSIDIEFIYHRSLLYLLELIASDVHFLDDNWAYQQMDSNLRSLMDDYLRFIRGDADKGYNPLRSFSKDIDTLILSNTCLNLSTTNSTTQSLLKWNPNNTIEENQILFSCMSIDELMGYIVSSMEQFKEEAHGEIFSGAVLVDLYFRQEFTMSLIFREKMERVLTLLVEVIDNIISVNVTASVTSIIIALCFLINVIVYNIWRSFVRDMNQLRTMFHFISAETIEGNEWVLSYIVNNQLNFKKKSRVHPVDGEGTGDTFLLQKTFESCVDGAIIFNQEGIVETINQVALSLFGIKSLSDIIGTPFCNIFQYRDVIEKKIQAMVKSDTANGETLEVDAKRSFHLPNSKTFPVRLNLCIAFLNSNKQQKKCIFVGIVKDITSEKKAVELLNMEKKKSENLLLNIFPQIVANKLMKGDTFIAEKFDDVTCFFSDMVGFTKMSSVMSPSGLVEMLNELVNKFDELTVKYNLEKIKTIGDAYFCAGGLHGQQSDHPERMLRFAITVFGELHQYNIRNGRDVLNSLQLRIGIHTGAVVGGVIGTKKFAYDLWGDAVNTASRMESTSIPGRIQISRPTYERVHDLVLSDGFTKGQVVEFDEQKVQVKGKGIMTTYILQEQFHSRSLFENSDTEQIHLQPLLDNEPTNCDE